MKKSFLLLLLFSCLLNSQSKKKYKVIKGDTEIIYNEDEGKYSTYIKYKSYLGQVKENSGSLLEWRFDGIKQPILADWTNYHKRSFGNYFKKGERREHFEFTFLNGKLNT